MRVGGTDRDSLKRVQHWQNSYSVDESTGRMRTVDEIRERIRAIENLDSTEHDGDDDGGAARDAEYYGYREALLWVLEENSNDPFE